MDGRRIRPLFLPPHPRRNRYTPSSSLQTPYPALRRKRQSLVIPLQLLSEHDPLCWARVRAKDVGRQTMDVRRETLELFQPGAVFWPRPDLDFEMQNLWLCPLDVRSLKMFPRREGRGMHGNEGR